MAPESIALTQSLFWLEEELLIWEGRGGLLTSFPWRGGGGGEGGLIGDLRIESLLGS